MISAFWEPSQSIARHRERGITEETNIALLFAFAVINYVARLPGLYRTFQSGPQTVTDPETGEVITLDFAWIAGWDAVWSVFGVILVMYGLAAIAHYVTKKRGGTASGMYSRRAMFWAAVMSLPLVVVTSIATAFGIPNLAAILGFGTLIYFIWYWTKSLNELHHATL